MARKSKKISDVPGIKTKEFKVIAPIKGRFNNRHLDYKIGDIVELSLFEKYIYRDYIEEL